MREHFVASDEVCAYSESRVICLIGEPLLRRSHWLSSSLIGFSFFFLFFLNDRREWKVSQIRRRSKRGSAEEQMAACTWMLRSVMFYPWCRKGSGSVCVCVCVCVCGCVRVFSQLRVKRDPVHMLMKHFSSLMPFHSFTFPSHPGCFVMWEDESVILLKCTVYTPFTQALLCSALERLGSSI